MPRSRKLKPSIDVPAGGPAGTKPEWTQESSAPVAIDWRSAAAAASDLVIDVAPVAPPELVAPAPRIPGYARVLERASAPFQIGLVCGLALIWWALPRYPRK